MNQLTIEVYSTVKNMRFFLFCILLSIQGYGQNALFPFEFERYPASYYQNVISELDADFSSESDALIFYMTAYKLQRANNPGDYFISPNVERNLAREYILAFHSGGFSLALIEFLESQGSTDAASKLAESKSIYPAGIFYNYLGAKCVKQDEKVREALEDLEKSKLISPVTKAFGLNSVLSAEGNTIIATQGFQDMMAVDYALMKLKIKNVRVLNHFLESMPSNLTPKISLELSLDPSRIWISPTMTQSFFTEYSEGLWLAGIGMQWNQSGALNVIVAEWKLENVGQGFEGIREAPLTPADKGLIRSYKMFADAYFQLAEIKGDEKQKAKATTLKEYIQPYLNE
jgi:hypothetical protein